MAAFRYEQFLIAGGKIIQLIRWHPFSFSILLIFSLLVSWYAVRVIASRYAHHEPEIANGKVSVPANIPISAARPQSQLAEPHKTAKAVKVPKPANASSPQLKVDNNSGNSAGANNGTQKIDNSIHQELIHNEGTIGSITIGDPPTIKQFVVEVNTTCNLADPARVPVDVVMSTAGEDSYIGGQSGRETMTDGVYTFTTPTADGIVVATQKFSLAPTSSLIGSPTSSLYKGYNLLHIVDYAVARGYFKKCTDIALTLEVNGNNVMHIEHQISAEMDNIHGLSFDIGLTSH